ncbi:helix-turn-helix domain-containing protein [Actinomadura kijaniata]|uniref:helix-turn-helix domain-containing protein n=1 Tax=Actinomadura kijaniata TaxID=46161 RepID=UPI003F1BA5DF
MAPKRNKATVSPSLLAFGKRFRSYREAKHWTQEACAARANNGAGVKYQYIGAIENGRTRCTLGFVEIMDRELEAHGELVALWHDLVKEAAYPTWFDWPEVESQAAELTTWEHTIIPGLLQTPNYARAFLGSDEALEARLARQRILTRAENPVALVALISETALRNLVTSREVMREQLEYLVEVSALPNVTVQIVVNDGRPAGTGGAFVVATMEDRSEVAYLETVVRGITSDDPQDLSGIARSLRSLRGRALPVDMSRDAVRKVIEELWT